MLYILILGLIIAYTQPAVRMYLELEQFKNEIKNFELLDFDVKKQELTKFLTNSDKAKKNFNDDELGEFSLLQHYTSQGLQDFFAFDEHFTLDAVKLNTVIEYTITQSRIDILEFILQNARNIDKIWPEYIIVALKNIDEEYEGSGIIVRKFIVMKNNDILPNIIKKLIEYGNVKFLNHDISIFENLKLIANLDLCNEFKQILKATPPENYGNLPKWAQVLINKLRDNHDELIEFEKKLLSDLILNDEIKNFQELLIGNTANDFSGGEPDVDLHDSSTPTSGCGISNDCE